MELWAVLALIMTLWGFLYHQQGKQIDDLNKRFEDSVQSQSKRFDDFAQSQSKKFDDFTEYFKGTLNQVVQTQKQIALQLNNHVTDTDRKITALQNNQETMQQDLIEIKELLRKQK